VKTIVSVVVLALPLVIGLSGCAEPVRPSEPRHFVPSTIAPVALLDFDLVSFVDVDLHTAVQTREAVELEFGKQYGLAGHPRWFFHSFDRENLDFVVARYEPTSTDKHGSRYVAQRRLRVKRSPEAERALGVSELVREYEVGGAKGVKAGMTRREATRRLGRAESERPLTSPNTTEVRYNAACVVYVDEKVARVWPRDVCTR
jgi:hypothetical protein